MSAEMKTTTVQALLGMLTLCPMSGYDLKQRIEGSIGNFWSESYGQIYPTLKAMATDGLVTAMEEGKAGRTMYTLTDAGRDHLREWLSVAPRRRVPRHELLLKLFFGQLAPAETMRAYVEAERKRFAADLARYATLGQGIDANVHGPERFFYRITLDYGMREARMIVEWCDETLAVLDRMQQAAGEQEQVEVTYGR